MTRIIATYLVHATPAEIEARARAIAIEQSVEMPLEAIADDFILRGIVGEVQSIADRGGGVFAVRIGLAASTIGADAGQLFNMAFGNTSLQEDVVLADLNVPPGLFPGPRVGIAGLRARTGAVGRAFTASAIKPQGLPPERLAAIAAGFAAGGIDFVKDDHGLADQHYAPFAARVPLCADAVRRAGHARYVPSVTGSLDAMRAQIGLARDCGLDCVMVAPMIAGPANVRALADEFPGMAFLAHPTLGGAARIAPELLIGKLFPLLGADAVIFPNYGGRFGYSPGTCADLAANARGLGAVPVPAGGMTLARVPEMLDFYGADAMLLIGGSLLAARERLAEATARFANAVAAHRYRK
ncbi:MAG TPA: RuBisCO large subunit C-terminal-like domain-containing protein [Acetobacteraceae bacterium]|nr:RuBisCO large subunit C-terminal-like domain-containing protein [Acetobacteraceae bacterium]